MDKDNETVDVFNSRLWELYKSECSHSGVKPSMKGYLVWVDEQY